jgi:hypothetical protein
MPREGSLLLATRAVNHFLGTNYRPEEVAAFDPAVFRVLEALHAGLRPPESG